MVLCQKRFEFVCQGEWVSGGVGDGDYGWVVCRGSIVVNVVVTVYV